MTVYGYHIIPENVRLKKPICSAKNYKVWDANKRMLHSGTVQLCEKYDIF